MKLALAIVQSAALAVSPTAEPRLQTEPPPSAARQPLAAEPAVTHASGAEGTRFESCGTARKFNCCVAGHGYCTRSRPARLILGVVGAAAWGLGAALLVLVGDSLGAGDPSGLMIGGGALGLLGAVVGSVAGLLGNDRPGHPDRVKPGTVDLEYTFGRLPATDESTPDVLRAHFAPTYAFPGDQGRIRLIGHVGGWLGNATAVDPRPQNDQPIDGQNGTFPVVLSERRLDVGVGLDLAVKLPYPLLRPERSSALGQAELRFKPVVRIRRHVRSLGDQDEQIDERVMLLPLTVGARWYLSERQRFTFYIGPRFDFLAFSDPGSESLERGRPQNGPVYGEAWYDIDVPLTERPRPSGKPRRVDVIGMLTLGYVHSRFDGLAAFNLGPAIGFLGPGHVGWNMRIRRRGMPVAFQTGVGVWVGTGAAAFLRVGLVAPDLTGEHFRRRKRR